MNRNSEGGLAKRIAQGGVLAFSPRFDAGRYLMGEPPIEWDGKTQHLYIEDGKYLWHGDHPFNAEWDCCLEAVAKLMGYSWAKYREARNDKNRVK